MRKAQQFLKRDLNFCAKWLIRERRLPGAQSDLPAGLLQELQRMMKQRRVPLRRQILAPGVRTTSALASCLITGKARRRRSTSPRSTTPVSQNTLSTSGRGSSPTGWP